MRPITVPQYVKEILNKDNDSLTKNIQACYPKLYKGNPLVTIVIPAYNEEKNILYTLLSIAQNITDKSVEIIVVNNNSKDNTEQIVKATGVTCINEPTPGVKHARNAGLHAASSEFIINADADTLYPPTWIETMINPLINKQGVALSYGRFAFLPPVYEKRWQYFIYENFADVQGCSKNGLKKKP